MTKLIFLVKNWNNIVMFRVEQTSVNIQLCVCGIVPYASLKPTNAIIIYIPTVNLYSCSVINRSYKKEDKEELISAQLLQFTHNFTNNEE